MFLEIYEVVFKQRSGIDGYFTRKFRSKIKINIFSKQKRRHSMREHSSGSVGQCSGSQTFWFSGALNILEFFRSPPNQNIGLSQGKLKITSSFPSFPIQKRIRIFKLLCCLQLFLINNQNSRFSCEIEKKCIQKSDYAVNSENLKANTFFNGDNIKCAIEAVSVTPAL